MRGFLLEEKTSISDSGIPIDPDPELPGMTGSEIGRDEVAWEEQVSVFEAAAAGRLDECERLYRIKPDRLEIRDSKGRSVLHHAALNGHTNIIDFALDHTADVDLKDNDGNTALLLAVQEDHPAAVERLLVRGADPEIVDASKAAPIHKAVELNRVQVLEVMLRQKSVDPNLAGTGGGETALHYAAWKDHPDCAKLLLEHQAMMCKKCNAGLSPLHMAALNSASRTLEALLQHAEKAGYKREDVLKFVNQDKSTPLHLAVNGGDVQAVKVCLDAGARIDTPQEDGANPVHVAAGQGNVDMLKTMFEHQPERKDVSMNAADKCRMTPLHKAALFNKVEAALYLLDQGAELDPVCDSGHTPLLLAASKAAWAVTRELVKRGADLSQRDEDDRNLLHLIIKGGGQPSQFSLCMCSATMKNLLNQADKYGCTPLHYASMEGHVTTINALLTLGASLTARSHQKQSALHFAARYGRINTCRRLLGTEAGSKIVNETDGRGQSAIHAAAENGHSKVLQLLLLHGASINRDVNGCTPLHYAAKNGYTQSMAVLLNVQSSLIDMDNKESDTPLHMASQFGHPKAVSLLLSEGAKITNNQEGAHFLDLAIKHEQRDVCAAIISHDRWRDAMRSVSSMYGCPMVGMIKYMPDICEMVLDQCRRACNGEKGDSFHHHYDYQFLQIPLSKVKEFRDRGQDYTPMVALNMMVKYNRVDCLSHPVCLMFLRMKWCAYGLWFHALNLMIYIMFLASLTGFIASYDPRYMEAGITGVMKGVDSPKNNVLNGSISTEPSTPEPIQHGILPHNAVELNPVQRFLVFVILIFSILNAIKEVVQMIQQKQKYFTDMSNLLEWVLYVTTAVFVGPFIVGWTSGPQWECAALSVFLAWFNLLLFLQRFDFFGIYVVMFLQILKTLIKVLFVFSIMIVAFGLSFYILLCMEKEGFGFRTPALSLMSTVVMMIGSVEYIDNWINPLFNGNAMLVAMRFIMLCIFIFLMPILLINLLIGLAVGDIESVKRDARLKRLAMQVQLHTDLEKKLPHRLLVMVDKDASKVYPNSPCKNFFSRLVHRVTKSSGDYDPDQRDVKEGKDIDVTAEHQNYVCEELYKQKQRLKHISSDLQRQNDLLRLIVQKMEIHDEADDWDEGETVMTQNGAPKSGRQRALGWSSPAVRHTLMKQISVVGKWKSAAEKC